ncbi:hypothetical protein GCM10025857_37730 [Alicyclobacillus contaminans]|nr:hypothetical protein GCM10025857_37730 [Alicyclobacillus contaminans]
MLLELTIERLALIDSVRLKLDSGFHVFTGETGAGKSILLDAIGLLVGNRGSAEWIRKDEDSAFVEAVFALSPSVQARVVPLLQDWGIPEEDGTLVISRELFQTGRTVCRVNGRLATVQMLRELGAKLVQQHGQHDTQGLLRPDEQLRMLDLYGRHAEQVAEVRKAYRNYRAALDAYRDSLMGEQERIQRLDMLEFQIREIEDARLQPGEEEMLRERRQRLQHMDKVASALEQAKNYLDGQAVQWLSEAAREVAAAVAYQPSLQETLDLLETAQVHAEEALHQLRREEINGIWTLLNWSELKTAWFN